MRSPIATKLLAAICVLAVVSCDGASVVRGGGGDAVVVGLAGPLELNYGRSMRQAAEMAAEEINAAGGVDGRSLELVFRDDQADAQRAISVANEFTANPRVVAVVGHLTSGATLAAAGIYNGRENGLLQISPTASSPLVTGAGPWTFRVCPTDLAHGPALASWLTDQLSRQRAEILYSNEPYGRGVLASFTEAFQSQGGTVIGSDPFLPAFAQGDGMLDPFIRRAQQRGADAMVIGGLADQAVAIIRDARRLGYTGPIAGADGLLGIEAAGEEVEGVYVSTPFLPDRPEPATREFVAAYQERYGELPDAYAALSYDALRLVVQAIEEAGTNRRDIRDYINSVGRRSPAFEGVTGSIGFDENGDAEGKSVVIGVVRDGEIVSASR